MTGATRRCARHSRTFLAVANSDSSFARFAHDQVITEQQGQELAEELGLRFLETSAKSNINVEEAFFALARDIKARLIDSAPPGAPGSASSSGAGAGASSVGLGSGGSSGKSGCC